MAFASGPISMRRFAVGGQSPQTVDQPLLDRLAELALAPDEVGVPPEIDYGWCGGRHILDRRFTFEHNVFSDALSFALRVDTNRIPAELCKAYQILEEDAVAASNPSGFISKKQKKEVKESLGQKLDDELRTGKFRRSKMTPILWDLPSKTVYSPANGNTASQLIELFERTFQLALEPLTAGTVALAKMEQQLSRRDYEDLRPTRFVPSPEGDSHFPEYPWTAKGPQPKDFLGNEFLLWLWHEAEHRDGEIATEAVGEVTVFIDKTLDLDCAFGLSGRDGLRSQGPARMPEARDGLRSGKVPRKVGLVIDVKRQQFSFTLNAESFSLTAVKLPDVDEADSPRTLFEERVALLRDLCQAVDALYATFLNIRCSSSWEGHTSGIRKWILQSPKAIMAVA